MSSELPPTELYIFTDGGSRGNPGPAATGIYVVDKDGREVYKNHRYLGIATNNQAEYQALLDSLQWLRSSSLLPHILKVFWHLDSLLVVNQVNGVWRIKDQTLKNELKKIRSILSELKNEGVDTIVTHIRREKNKAADSLVNLALDTELL